MSEEHQLIKDVYAAKENTEKADDLIRKYIPFIRAAAAKHMAGICTDQDDEYSIAMMAFYEAIMGYKKEKGSFLNYADMLIRSRIIDYGRKELRHLGNISLYEENDDDDNRSLLNTLADKNDVFEEMVTREATQQEIKELSVVMRKFNVSFADVADNCPKQERTMEACVAAIKYAADNPLILDELLRTKKLPLAKFVRGCKAERKTLERHRKYILVMLLIQTNGYEIMRGHLQKIFKRKENRT